MPKVRKTELIANLKEEIPDLTKKDITKVVDATIAAIKDIIVAGDSITIHGFASFGSKQAAPRTFRQINTGTQTEVGARTLPKAKFAKSFVRNVKEAN